SAELPEDMGDLAGSIPNQTVALREVAVELTIRQVERSRAMASDADLATSLNNLSVRLGDLGRAEAALAAIQEAVEIRRSLAQARPDTFLRDLAMSLNNLSSGLAALGRREEALAASQEAADAHRFLVQA